MDLRGPERSIEKLAHAQHSLLVRRGEIECGTPYGQRRRLMRIPAQSSIPAIGFDFLTVTSTLSI